MDMESSEKKTLRILVTGRLGKVTNDICEHLEADRDYSTQQCPPKRAEMLQACLNIRPHIVILCLQNEDPKTIETFDVLEQALKSDLSIILVVANEADKEIFTQNTSLSRATILLRPFSLSALYFKLDELEDRRAELAQKYNSAFSDFVNAPVSRSALRRRILVVDDDPTQLVQIRDHLREFYDATLVGSGESALKYLERCKVDLILLDYMMPEMSGAEVLAELRRRPNLADIPVVFLTGVTEKRTVVKIITELKPQGYVVKPVKKAELVAKIIETLG